MALRTIKKTYKKNDDIRVGYKVYQRENKDGPRYYPEYQYGSASLGEQKKASLYGRQTLLASRSKFEYAATSSVVYDVGFHLFSTKEGAKEHINQKYILNKYVVVECTAWDIRAEGRQFDQDVFVAKNIQLMREVN
jgi:hypothetical protein